MSAVKKYPDCSTVHVFESVHVWQPVGHKVQVVPSLKYESLHVKHTSGVAELHVLHNKLHKRSQVLSFELYP